MSETINIEFPNGVKNTQTSEILEDKIREVIERYTNDRAKIRSDKTGNEVTANPESGEVILLKKCDNTDHEGKVRNPKKVRMKEEFEGGKAVWCESCRNRDGDIVEETTEVNF